MKKKRKKISMEPELESSFKMGSKKMMAVGIAVAVLLGVALPVVLLWPKKEAPVATSISQPLPVSISQPLPVSLPPSSSVAPPTSVASQPEIVLEFTEEERAALDAMLAEWAEKETFPLITEDDKGNPLSEPRREADGGHEVAVWFLDLESGAQYSYNASTPYYYASMMKAPYAAYLYQLAAQGACNLADEVTITTEDIGKYAENSGVIKTLPLPATFTIDQLLTYLLRNSDTVALRMLLARYPASGFLQWAEALGLEDAAAIKSVIYGKVSASDAGRLLMAVYDTIHQPPYGDVLRANMVNSANRMIASDYEVAHKYGWDEGAYHDMAVVFAPHPYLLVIMTDKWGGTYEETAMFGKISRQLEQMMAEKWATVGG